MGGDFQQCAHSHTWRVWKVNVQGQDDFFSAETDKEIYKVYVHLERKAHVFLRVASGICTCFSSRAVRVQLGVGPELHPKLNKASSPPTLIEELTNTKPPCSNNVTKCDVLIKCCQVPVNCLSLSRK